MLRHRPHAFRIAVWLTLGCLAQASPSAEPIGPVGSPREYSASPTRPSSVAAVEAAQARVAAARAQPGTAASQLTQALTALGAARFEQGEYVSAEAAYREALQLAEQRGGANGVGLFEPMRGLGITLVEEGRHADAVPYLERALGIARAGYGVFDLRQQELLRQLAMSLTALGRADDAERHVLYSLHVAEKTYGVGDPNVAAAICQAADWFAATGQSGRALVAFKVALNIVHASLGEGDLAAVGPLRGLANVYMLEVSHPDSIRTPRNKGFHPVDSGGVPVSKPRVLNPEGERALQRALSIIDAHPQASFRLRIDTLVQMGDWFQIDKSPNEALPYYRRAARLMAEASPRPDVPALLDFPMRVFYPTPSIVAQNLATASSEVESHYVQVEFSVTAEGAVSEARIVEHDTTRRLAAQVLDAVRAARYRPRFIDDQPVATSAMSYREVFQTRAPREN